MGPKTILVLKRFQAGQGLAQTGKLDEETGNALSYFAAATSKSGSVKKLAAVAPSTIASLSRARQGGGLQPVDIGSGWVARDSRGRRYGMFSREKFFFPRKGASVSSEFLKVWKLRSVWKLRL
jgi:hypothetical protein